jgi:hypothetical protein
MLQLHRPLVSMGSTPQVDWSMGWQRWPAPHARPQPPQFEELMVVLIHTPLQQRSAAVDPHCAPSGRGW